jgi:ribosomal subunit interface protein
MGSVFFFPPNGGRLVTSVSRNTRFRSLFETGRAAGLALCGPRDTARVHGSPRCKVRRIHGKSLKSSRPSINLAAAGGTELVMQIQISGKNMDIGDALRGEIEDRLSDDVAKYFDGMADGHVTITKDGGEFRADCAVHLSTGMKLQSQGRATDAHACFEIAADKLSKRLRRYKRRLKDHHAHRSEPVPSFEASSYVIEAGGEEMEPDAINPPIIAESTEQLQELSVGEAAMKLDISDAQFVFFRNARTGGLNVVFRRDDGNIGWLEPM